jgi:6-pyruvoyltetrahydropterin/6-carboxytetrahydropterin synthase
LAALEFSRRYSMAHRLITDPGGKCAVPHGHDEIVRVRLAPLAPFRFGGANAAAPFERIKGAWHGFIDGAVDHAFQLNAADPLLAYFQRHEPQRTPRLMVFDGDPTTEALAASFWLKLAAFLAAADLPYAVDSVRVEETPTNAVIVTRASFDPDACGVAASAWQRRADMTINDL